MLKIMFKPMFTNSASGVLAAAAQHQTMQSPSLELT
jgi:hypothetical protein